MVEGVQLYGKEGLKGGYERVLGSKSMSKTIIKKNLCPTQNNEIRGEDFMLSKITVSKALLKRRIRKSKNEYSNEKETITHSPELKKKDRKTQEDP